MSAESAKPSIFKQFLLALGPAIIVACVVMGPGSILTSSRVGCEYGFSMQWMLFVSVALMFGVVATSSRVGALLEHSPCEELTRRLGRPVAAVAGLSVFAIASLFQFSNNLGVWAGLEPIVGTAPTMKVTLLVGLNLLFVACLFGFRSLYPPVEKLMMVLMGLMLLGFAANLLMIWPPLPAILKGWIPSLPDSLTQNFLPHLETPVAEAGKSSKPIVVDAWGSLQGMVATTFSIAGAFYYAYLVREKGWRKGELTKGLLDSTAGMVLLASLSLMIMLTSATVLFGDTKPGDLKTAGDVASQLEPLFGAAAKWLFCLGILAGSISSFLVNSMVGGTLLADGLGLPSRIDSIYTKLGTTLCLAIGAVVTLCTNSDSIVSVLIAAQASTVLGGPVLAAALLYLATRRTADGSRVAPTWMIAMTSLGGLVVLLLAVRTAIKLLLPIM